MELWLEYLGADLGSPLAPNRLRQFFEAMSAEGLLTASMEQVEKFLGIWPQDTR